MAATAQQPWLAIFLLMAAFVTLIAALALYRNLARREPDPENLRKLLHVGSGLLTLTFPFLFADLWPVLLLTSLSAITIASLKWLRPLRARLGGVIGGDDRTTLGEIYFPIAVALVFWLAQGRSPLLFCVPILVLTLADATGALIGIRYGRTKYVGATKSLEGSVAFAVVAFFCIDVPLTVWSDVGRVETLLIASTLALLVMLLEGSAWRGLDNLFVPLGVFFVLRVWLDLDAPALLGRFLVTVLLVVLVVVLRRRSTLEDDALLAGAFCCYVTWALAGWRWLVPPAIAFVGYVWMSPRTVENSKRIHDVPAVLSVWAFALLWLALARGTGAGGPYFPFTLVFAAHLAIFGASRIASDFPRRALRGVMAEAIVKSWLMFFLPFVAIAGASATSLVLALGAVVPVALGVLGFAAFQRELEGRSLRDTSQKLQRWILQAGIAGLASLVGWMALLPIEGWMGGW
jgi:phytol kinase